MTTGLLGFDEVQQRQAGPLAYVSPSRLSCWLSCPLKWAFRYRDGLRTPTTAALFTGKAIHASLECYYRHRQLGIMLGADDVNRRSQESWAQLVDEEDMEFDSPESETAMRQQMADLVKATPAQRPTAGRLRPSLPLEAPNNRNRFERGAIFFSDQAELATNQPVSTINP